MFTVFCLSIFKTANIFSQLPLSKFLFIKFILETTQNHRDLKYLLSGFAGTDTLLEILPVRDPQSSSSSSSSPSLQNFFTLTTELTTGNRLFLELSSYNKQSSQNNSFSIKRINEPAKKTLQFYLQPEDGELPFNLHDSRTTVLSAETRDSTTECENQTCISLKMELQITFRK